MSDKSRQLLERRASARGLGRGDPFLPLVNIAFLLLTFFLLVFALRIGTEIAARGGTVTLRIEANGVLHFEGRTMTDSEAVAAVRGALDATPRGPLDIQADRSTPASTILPLLQKLQEGGVASFQLCSGPARRSPLKARKHDPVQARCPETIASRSDATKNPPASIAECRANII